MYANGCDLITQTEQEIQALMDKHSHASKAFGLTISLDKTVVMFQLAPGSPYIKPSILVVGHKLKVVDSHTLGTL